MRIEVMELDTVRDLTVVDIRYKAATTEATAHCSHDLAVEFWASQVGSRS